MRKRLALTLAALIAATAPALAATSLTGAGSTWDYPFFSKAFFDYGKAHNVEVNYQSIGSGGGIQQFTQRTVDFGATDVPMNAKEVKAAEASGGPVLQIPVVLGGVSVAYNLPGIGSGLHLTPAVVANIYLGKIANWNDPAIVKLNPKVKLPNLAIIVVHRSDGSGTTYTFTDFLSHVSPEWASKVGKGKDVSWPAPSAVGGKGNEGVAGQISNSPGAIGYVELAYVLQNRMPQALLLNRAGKWVEDTQAGVRAAAATKPTVSATDFSIVDTHCAACYPIAGYSWVVVYKNPQDKGRAKVLKQLLGWVASPSAQKIAGTLDYVPLPKNVQELAQRTIAQMHV
ncbi:MAG TPA: phosphate ABC transporter substrate-binding protein PstS [Candidatus Baltobacteraceae bacterium]|nr:phosphate ABC transporter substrate-binding protein PstS [Candidatus Baltobacteraceae bacterium]